MKQIVRCQICAVVDLEFDFVRRADIDSVTVLLVDDEADDRELAREALRSRGYTVLEASSGEEAMRVMRAHPEVAILFTDIVMPGEVDGFELAHQAKQLRPSLLAIYCCIAAVICSRASCQMSKNCRISICGECHLLSLLS